MTAARVEAARCCALAVWLESIGYGQQLTTPGAASRCAKKSEALWQCGVPVFWGQPSVGQSPKQKPFTACFGAEGGITERRLPAALGKVAGVYDPRPLKACGRATATQREPPVRTHD